jgi:hypothetical protein
MVAQDKDRAIQAFKIYYGQSPEGVIEGAYAAKDDPHVIGRGLGKGRGTG